ncbi:MAG TPA: glutamate synthase subunit beta [Nitrospiria bacterium]|nr:glutamate synthase subunit beta [Nitrospiria bacterium]
MGDIRGFLKSKREGPIRRPVAERVRDWKEFYQPIAEETLKTQGSRCMDCGVPFCQGDSGCPVQNMIPDWNDLVYRGRWPDALKMLHSTNNFPEFTGRLCPAPCESACVLGIIDDPVSIRVIEWNIIDRGFDAGLVTPVQPEKRTGRRVAVVGSGPAGLAAAQQLCRLGHAVTVFERDDRIGGLLRYGIPDFKMEKRVIDRRLQQMRAEGVEFRTGVHVGTHPTVKALHAEYDAVCLAIGAMKPRELPVPGRELDGIHLAMDYLTQQNRINAGDGLRPGERRITAEGKRVVIIGGGDTGSDCLGTAHRQGAREVHQFEILPQPPEHRAASTPWPYWPMQLRSSHAHEEGCDRQWSVSTTHFSGSGGLVERLHAVRVAPESDAQGRTRFVPQPGTDFVIQAELVLLAMGFSGPVTDGLVELGVKLDARGNIAVNDLCMTSVDGLFAAGDAKRGASLIVWAIREGRDAARGIDQYLQTVKR